MSDTPNQGRNDHPAAQTTPGAPAAPPSTPSKALAQKPKAPLASQPRTAPPAFECLPPFRVLLHNDDHNDMMFVVRSIVELTPLNAPLARDIMLTAQECGVAQVLVTHKERAELYQEQFASKGLVTTIEAAT